jgi:hypothetical protein
VRSERTLLETAGERIAIERLRWVGGEPGGRFEIEFVWVSEVNETGHFSATVAFDPEDARAAQREASARWAAIDPAAYAVAKPIDELTDACNEKDPLKFRACLDDDIVADDHRLAGIGRIRGADAYFEAVRVLGARAGHAGRDGHAVACLRPPRIDHRTASRRSASRGRFRPGSRFARGALRCARGGDRA